MVIVNTRSCWTSEEENDEDEPYEQYEQSFQVVVYEEEGKLKINKGYFGRVD
ncbi:MAG: hypothetical protein N4J56_007133 [Chroococcidiopsis sp. SAG 2025]|uniref:hypothetical protein n=1 Tax=Chroococcidiopsis sp. SAG 2025 TaxID=171389 RepID=UPI002936E192|nr:hypothetical protein [Chroococcidiopsis sp. SAG 2025]MDV2997428.1 hypothetical protein [Chroococcidiopsis sp. SAG 2025]